MLLFVLDEHLRGRLWHALARHNLLGGLQIDAVRVGDAPNLPLGADDNVILEWADRNNRILVTQDKHTMAKHLADRLQNGQSSPGVLMLRAGSSLRAVLDSLELAAHAGSPQDFADAITFFP
jgi:predicted nuclease of predicted toxin-antitoxin system